MEQVIDEADLQTLKEIARSAKSRIEKIELDDKVNKAKIPTCLKGKLHVFIFTQGTFYDRLCLEVNGLPITARYECEEGN